MGRGLLAAAAAAAAAAGATGAAAAAAPSSSSSILMPLATVTPLAWHPPSTATPASAFCVPPLLPTVRGRAAAAPTAPWRLGQPLQRGRQLLRMFDEGAGGGGERPPAPAPMPRRKGPGIRGGSSGGGRAALKAEQELWEARRNISRVVLRPVAKLVQRKEHLLRERLARGEAAAEQKGEDVRNAVVATALLLAVVTAVARLGGRAAVLSMMGLDMLKDADLAGRLDSVLGGVEGLGALKLPAFLMLWVVAKTFCVDALALVLALASGVIFGGVLEGALYSTACATLASLVGFQLARTLFRKQVVAQLEKRPLLRALERAVAKDGVKAVFTFRLSPLVPALPIGGYNYLYGVTSISAAEFLAGIFAGSLKPYFLDSYLGVWGKDLLGGDGALDLTQSALLFLTFFVLVLVGTLAAQIAGRAFDEAKQEALMMTGGAEDAGASGWGGAEQEEGDGWDWFTMLGIERPKNGLVVDEWRRLDRAVQEEWRGVLAEAVAAAPTGTGTGAGAGTAQQASAPAPAPSTEVEVDVVPPYLDFDPAGQRPPRPLRKPPQLTTTLVGLALFPFVLLGTATGKLGDAVSSSASASMQQQAQAAATASGGGGGARQGEGGGEEEEEGGGGNDFPPTVTL